MVLGKWGKATGVSRVTISRRGERFVRVTFIWELVMASQLSARSEFTETLAIHVGLKNALKANEYSKIPAVQKAAEKLCQELAGERSIYGRQLSMIRLMEKGASIEALGRKLRCSRRTVFRYLNHLEDAGVSIKLENGKYGVDKSVGRMLRA